MSAILNFDTLSRASVTVPVTLLPHFGSVDLDAVRESWSAAEMLTHAGEAFDKISAHVADAIQEGSRDDWTSGGHKVWFRKVESDADPGPELDDSGSETGGCGMMQSGEVVGLEGFVDEAGWTVVGKDVAPSASFGDLEVETVTFEMTRGEDAEGEPCLVVECVEVVGGKGEVVLRCKARFGDV